MFSAMSPRGLAAGASAHIPLRIPLFSIVLRVLWTQVSLAFRVRCFGGPLDGGSLKSWVLDVLSKSSAFQGQLGVGVPF